MKTKKVVKYNKAVGVLLLIEAIPIAQIIRALVMQPYMWISQLILIIAVAILFPFSINKIRSVNSDSLLLLFFLLVLFLCSLGYRKGSGNWVYNLFGVVVFFSLFTNKEKIDLQVISKMGFYISGFISFACAYVLTEGFANFLKGINTLYSANGVALADRLILSNVALSSFVFIISYNTKKKTDIFLKILFIVFDCIIFINTARRSKAIIFAVMIFLRLDFGRKIKAKKALYIVFGSICLFVVFFYCVLKFSWMQEWLLKYINSVYSAISSFLGNSNSGDVSGLTRNTLVKEMAVRMSKWNIMNFLFGEGYMTLYMDVPFLQVFLDFGLWGFFCFFYLQIIIPLKYIFCHHKNNTHTFLSYFLVSSIINVFFSGIPYGWDKWLYVTMMLCLEKSEREIIYQV